jgi:hypothetical protein
MLFITPTHDVLLFITAIHDAFLVANYVVGVIAKYVIHNTNTWLLNSAYDAWQVN